MDDEMDGEMDTERLSRLKGMTEEQKRLFAMDHSDLIARAQPALPAGPTEILVTKTVRLSSDSMDELEAEAARQGKKARTLMREYIEAGLAADRSAEGHELKVSLNEAVRMLRALARGEAA